MVAIKNQKQPAGNYCGEDKPHYFHKKVQSNSWWEGGLIKWFVAFFTNKINYLLTGLTQFFPNGQTFLYNKEDLVVLFLF